MLCVASSAGMPLLPWAAKSLAVVCWSDCCCLLSPGCNIQASTRAALTFAGDSVIAKVLAASVCKGSDYNGGTCTLQDGSTGTCMAGVCKVGQCQWLPPTACCCSSRFGVRVSHEVQHLLAESWKLYVRRRGATQTPTARGRASSAMPPLMRASLLPSRVPARTKMARQDTAMQGIARCGSPMWSQSSPCCWITCSS